MSLKDYNQEIYRKSSTFYNFLNLSSKLFDYKLKIFRAGDLETLQMIIASINLDHTPIRVYN